MILPVYGSVETGMNGNSRQNHEKSEGTTAIRNRTSRKAWMELAGN